MAEDTAVLEPDTAAGEEAPPDSYQPETEIPDETAPETEASSETPETGDEPEDEELPEQLSREEVEALLRDREARINESNRRKLENERKQADDNAKAQREAWEAQAAQQAYEQRVSAADNQLRQALGGRAHMLVNALHKQAAEQGLDDIPPQQLMGVVANELVPAVMHASMVRMVQDQGNRMAQQAPEYRESERVRQAKIAALANGSPEQLAYAFDLAAYEAQEVRWRKWAEDTVAARLAERDKADEGRAKAAEKTEQLRKNEEVRETQGRPARTSGSPPSRPRFATQTEYNAWVYQEHNEKGAMSKAEALRHLRAARNLPY